VRLGDRIYSLPRADDRRRVVAIGVESQAVEMRIVPTVRLMFDGPRVFRLDRVGLRCEVMTPMFVRPGKAP
jgi:hypothetical protein